MPTNSVRTTNDSNNSDSPINQDACEKYGISLNELPVEPVEPYSRYNEDDTVYGFVTEVSHDNNGTEVEIKDWGYCLENNTIELGFQNMPRSQIMEEVIKSYGLVPLVDLTGLRDDEISWNNSTSNDSNTGGGGNLTGDGSMTWEECWDIAQTWPYGGWGSNHDPELAWKTMGTQKGHSADCYDATAWLYYVLNFKVGVSARDIVGSGTGQSGTHHVIQTKKDGDWSFPSEYSNMDSGLGVTGGMKSGEYHVSREPPSSNGDIPEYKNNWYGNRS